MDLWLAVVVALAAAAPIAAGVWLAIQGETRGVIFLLCWGVVITLLITALSVPLRYTCRADHFHIQSGWLDWRVPYASVRRVALSANPLSAPAWSLRRVKLETADGLILVSPSDRESFIEELSARCPHLIRTADGLALPPPTP